MNVLATLITDEATPWLARASQELRDRSVLNLYIGRSVRNTLRDYLILQAPHRHKTAQALGGQPTGHLERAAESVDFTAVKEGVEVGIASPGISRTFHALHITPQNGKKYLTLPATGAAYGRRAGEFTDLFFVKLKGRPALARRDNGSLRVMYWLRSSVTVPQDRSLLPSDELLAAAAEEGARDFLSDVIDAQR